MIRKSIPRLAKNTIVINQQEMIRRISASTGIYQDSVKEIYSAFEEILKNSLLEVDEDTDVEVRFLPGLKIVGVFNPSHLHRMPDGRYVTIEDKLSLNFDMTDYCKKQLTEKYRTDRKIWKEWLESIQDDEEKENE